MAAGPGHPPFPVRGLVVLGSRGFYSLESNVYLHSCLPAHLHVPLTHPCYLIACGVTGTELQSRLKKKKKR